MAALYNSLAARPMMGWPRPETPGIWMRPQPAVLVETSERLLHTPPSAPSAGLSLGLAKRSTMLWPHSLNGKVLLGSG